GQRPAEGATRRRLRRHAPRPPRLLLDAAGFRVAVEDVDRAGREGGDVDAAPVGRDVDALRRRDRPPERATRRAQEYEAAGGTSVLDQRRRFDLGEGGDAVAE